MKIKIFNGLFFLFAIVLCLLGRCSSNSVDVSDGTETGNPDISASVSAIFEIMESDSAWKLLSYIDQSCLNPAVLDPSLEINNQHSLGKSKEKNDYHIDTIVIRDTLYRMKNFISAETLTVFDTTIISDTIISNYSRKDSVDTIIDTDIMKYVVEKKISDSIFIADTVENYRLVIVVDSVFITDTIYQFDTILVDNMENFLMGIGKKKVEILGKPVIKKEIIELSPFLTYDSCYYDPFSNTVQYIFIGIKGEVVIIYAKQNNYQVSHEAYISPVSFSRDYTTADGKNAYSKYCDTDGDGLLYSAENGVIPSVRLDERQTGQNSRKELTVEFNAGIDSDFSTIYNNKIITLNRHVLLGENTEETVSFVNTNTTNKNTDTLYLIVNKSSVSNTLKKVETHYRLLESDNHESPNDFTLIKVIQSREYQFINLAHIDLEISPSLLQNGSIEAVSFSAVIIYNNRTGYFNGTVNSQEGLIGTYEYNDTTYTVSATSNEGITVEK